MFEPPPIYPVTDTRISGLTHLDQVKRLIDGGATLIQLREKREGSRNFYDAAVDCIEYARPRGVRIIINDRADIALASAADGVHLGQDDMPPHAARALLGREAIIGCSTHSVEQAVAASSAPIDYVAIGPVFATNTKENPDPVVGLTGVKAVKAQLRGMPLVAIGGIDASNVGQVLAAGADSAAVVSGVLRSPEGITEATSELLRATLLNKEQK